jgi:DNA-binding beta-propeller fold protein YncE
VQKNPRIWLVILLCLALPLVAACSPHGTSSATSQVAPSQGEELYVLDGAFAGGSAGQRIVALHPDASGSVLASMPAGLTSQDHQRLYVANPHGNQTAITIYATRTAAALGVFVIPGAYSTGLYGYETGTLSPDGRWLALRQVTTDLRQTTIALVDTQARRVVKTEHLTGDFDLDALSPHARTLYLLQNTNDAQRHYYVRAYDLLTDQLDEPIIVDKTELDEANMLGQALTRQMAPDGSSSYTLYINQQENKAFIHILPLPDQPDAYLARCIDLPVGSTSDLLKDYTLALSPDGSTLYAANTALGVVTSVTVKADYVFDIQPGTTQQFRSNALSATGAEMLYHGAVVSSDQQILYLAGADGIWAVSTRDTHILGHYLGGQAYTSVALSADGRILYAVSPGQGIVLIDLSRGQIIRTIRGPAPSPWGIAWVNH